MLESFRLIAADQNAEFDEGLVSRISAALGLANRLTHLNMSEWEMGDNLVRLLGFGIRSNRSITTSYYITDAGIAAFLENWDEGSIIESLDLSFNQLTVVGAQQLLIAAANQLSLLHVDLRGSSAIGYSGLLTLAREIIPDLQLRTLDLSYCGDAKNIGDGEYIIEVKHKPIKKAASLALTEAMRRNEHLNK
jgi:hypothetical protein